MHERTIGTDGAFTPTSNSKSASANEVAYHWGKAIGETALGHQRVIVENRKLADELRAAKIREALLRRDASRAKAVAAIWFLGWAVVCLAWLMREVAL